MKERLFRWPEGRHLSTTCFAKDIVHCNDDGDDDCDSNGGDVGVNTIIDDNEDDRPPGDDDNDVNHLIDDGIYNYHALNDYDGTQYTLC